jgi:hypothetical protein
MSTIVNETCDVVLRHFGKLLLKQAFEACEDNRTRSVTIIVNNAELNLSISSF